MKLRSNIAWMIWLLVAGVLLRGLPHALAQPVASVPPVVMLAAMGEVSAEVSCHEHASAAHVPAPLDAPVHDHGSCKIACELGAAPALMIVPLIQAQAAHPVQVATVHSLVLADAVPPDHPPPI